MDTGPFSLYELLISLEKRGHLDQTLTGHSYQRPPAVARGEQRDTFTVSHTSHSVFKPNNVNQKQLKGSNIAGYVGMTRLEASSYLCLVWRASGWSGIEFFHFVAEMLVVFFNTQLFELWDSASKLFST